jgi:hypothetical protein
VADDLGEDPASGLDSTESATADVVDDTSGEEAVDIAELAEDALASIEDDGADVQAAAIVPRAFTHEDMVAALEGQPVMVRRIVYCECKYDPNVVAYRRDGTPLYYGCAQLMTGRGNGYDIFLRWGFEDWRDPAQVVGFINQVIDRGMLASQYPNTRRGCAGSP